MSTFLSKKFTITTRLNLEECHQRLGMAKEGRKFGYNKTKLFSQQDSNGYEFSALLTTETLMPLSEAKGQFVEQGGGCVVTGEAGVSRAVVLFLVLMIAFLVKNSSVAPWKEVVLLGVVGSLFGIGVLIYTVRVSSSTLIASLEDTFK